MSARCGICCGTIPDGETLEEHTAVCLSAEIVRKRVGSVLNAVREARPRCMGPNAPPELRAVHEAMCELDFDALALAVRQRPQD